MVLDPNERRAKLPAWITSTAVHAGLMLLLIFWVQRTPRGAAEEATRDVGIVLKRSTSDGVKFEGEEDTPADKTADVNLPNPVASDPSTALPDVASQSNAAEALPELPSIGSEANTGAPSAAAMSEGGGTTGGRPGEIGDKTTVRVFGVEGVGTKFVYLFDRSASMDGAPLAAAKREFVQSLTSLDDVHRFQIIFFNTSAQPFTISGRQRIAFATEQNKRLAERQLGGVTAHGGTDRLLALKNAIRMAPDVIFFLTDADDPMPQADLDVIIADNRRYNVMISTIEFGRGPNHGRDNFLKALARSTGGSYGYVNTHELR